MAVTPTSAVGNQQNWFQATVTAANDAVTLTGFMTWTYVGIQISGTWAGTMTFEVTVDGTNWAGVSATPSNSSTAVLTSTANGVWGVQIQGFAGIRARFSTATSGTATVSLKALPSQF